MDENRLRAILDFWKENVTKKPKHSHYDLTKESVWIESCEEIRKLVEELEGIVDEKILRNRLRRLLMSEKYDLIWAQKLRLLGTLLIHCDAVDLRKLKEIVLDVRDSGDFKEEWIDSIYSLIEKRYPKSLRRFKAAKALLFNVFGELFGKLHIEDRPIYNACSKRGLENLGFDFEKDDYDSFREAFDRFKFFYQSYLGKLSPENMPMNIEIDQFFNFFDKDEAANKQLAKKIISGETDYEVARFTFTKKDFDSCTGKRKDAEYLKKRFLKLRDVLIDVLDPSFNDFKDSIWIPKVTKASGRRGVSPKPRSSMWIGMAHKDHVKTFENNPRYAIQFQVSLNITDPFSIEIWMEDEAKKAREIAKSNLIENKEIFFDLIKKLDGFRLWLENDREFRKSVEELTLDQLEDFINHVDDDRAWVAIGKGFTQKDTLSLGYEVVNEIKRTLKQLLPVYELIALGKFEKPMIEPLNLQPSFIKTELEVDPEVIKQICANLNAGNHIIITGPVGTGKTTLAEDICRTAFEKKFCSGYILTTATSDWTTFDTIGGYMPTEEGKLKFEEGKFLEAIRENKWLIIDEINRADIDKAFGQLFTVLSGQKVELPFKHANGKSISVETTNENRSYFDDETATYNVGKNWRIIATMNIYDKNFLFEMSYAFMRRFSFVYLDVPERFGGLIDKWCEEKKVANETREKLKKLIELGERKMGPAIIKDIIDFIESRGNGERAIAEAVVSYILPQLEGLEKQKIREAWESIALLFEKKGIPNKTIRPILSEIAGVELREISEQRRANND
jgi:uncharacterized protein YktB (UPF0637 family)